MASNKAHRTETKNMFFEVFPDRYAAGFDKIHLASLEDKDEMMNQMVEDAEKDESIDKEIVLLLKSCKLAYEHATGITDMSFPLLVFLKDQKPNVKKIIMNKTRAKRSINDLQYFFESTGFYCDISTIFADLATIVSMVTNDYHQENIKDIDDYVVASIYKFIKTIQPEYYAAKWYLICLVSFIQEVANRIYNKEFSAKYYKRISNIVKSINMIMYICYENEGRLDELKKKPENTEIKVNEVEI